MPPYLSQSELENQFKARKNRDLLLSLVIDGIGMLTYLIPGLGELADIGFAPLLGVATAIVHKTAIGGVGTAVEEIVPGTDIIPSATLIWAYRYMSNEKTTYQQFLTQRK